MHRYVPLFFTGALLLGSACNLIGPSGDSKPLTGTTWQLVAFENAAGHRVDIGPLRSEFEQVAYTVVFTAEPADEYRDPTGTRRLKVIGYPNEGLFSYDRGRDRALTIYFHATTKINQLPGSEETEFFQALRTATAYRINGPRLHVAYDDGKILLFEARE